MPRDSYVAIIRKPLYFNPKVKRRTIIIVAAFACIIAVVCFLMHTKEIFIIDRTTVERATYFNVFLGDDCKGELSPSQIDEMVERFSAVTKAKRSTNYEGLTPGYQLCVFLKDRSFVYANGYLSANDEIEIVFDGKRYKVMDTEFAQYLRNVCSAGDTASAQWDRPN